jgi:hypothetical protein
MGIDEYTLCDAAKEYIPSQIKRRTLKDCAEYLSDFIIDNYKDSNIDINETEERKEYQVKLFIDELSRGMINSLYHSYMESYGIIEDLMILNEHNRLEIICNLTPYSFEYLELLNKEVRN